MVWFSSQNHNTPHHFDIFDVATSPWPGQRASQSPGGVRMGQDGSRIPQDLDVLYGDSWGFSTLDDNLILDFG